MNIKSRVGVTGMGVVASIGIGLENFWRNLLAGKSGISQIESFDTKNYRTHRAGEIKDFNAARFIENPNKFGRATQFLLAGVKLAIKDAGLGLSSLESKEVGVVVGVTALESRDIEEINQIRVDKGIEFIPYRLIARAVARLPSAVVGKKYRIKGPNLIIPTACAAGNYAIGYGFDLIRQGRIKIALCCGVDAFSRTVFTGLNRLFIVAPDICQPFDKNRRGMMIGEGCGVLILEDLDAALKRKAKIYAEVLGYGLSCDAYSTTVPLKEGVKAVMERAVKNADIKKEDVDYINAHGTGTISNDRAESVAIREVFGSLADNIPVSSIKSMLGHALGAASSIEAISCCLSIRDGIIPPTINYKTADPACNINVVANKARKKKINVVMNNSFAFGGNNACVIFSKIHPHTNFYKMYRKT